MWETIWSCSDFYPNEIRKKASDEEAFQLICHARDVLVALDNEFDYVFLGDVDGYAFFEKHYKRYHVPEKGNAGIFYLHPNEAGAKHLAKFWSKAIVKAAKATRE